FDFTDKQTGAQVMSSDRQLTIGDRYTVDVPDPRIDFRLAAAMAVGLDALLQRLRAFRISPAARLGARDSGVQRH
ncbi:MAG: hypothetical protein M3116_03100, partial [Actinomycetota bacterium]|nr:hypothetical protein [Actinomycetota bacterium]